IPVPETPAVWGLLLALSAAANVALREPVAVGVKVTLRSEERRVGKEEGLRGRSLLCTKSPGWDTVKPMRVIVNAGPRDIERLTAWAAPVVPPFWCWNCGWGAGVCSGGLIPVPETPAV